eukprot:4368668-Amphidinium_carterae.1
MGMGLKVDRLQEAKVPPRLLTDYCKVVEHHGVKFDLDNFMRTRERCALQLGRDQRFDTFQTASIQSCVTSECYSM